MRFTRHASVLGRRERPRGTGRIAIALFALFALHAARLAGQGVRDTLTGTVTDTAGHGVSSAAVSVRNEATNRSAETRTDSAGRYVVPDLAPGTYAVSVTASGFTLRDTTVAIGASGRQVADMRLTHGLSLGDLGFSTAQTEGNAQEQARLDKRSHMLRTHQRLGLITAIPMIATIFTGLSAGGRRTSSSDRDAHAALGSLTAGLYFTSAAFAILAPKVPGTKTHGQIILHKALAWIHGPGMILTPTLGIMAFVQKSRGERVQGIASAHGAVAIVTASAYGAAILSVSLKF